MDNIQKVLVKAGRKDLAQKYYLKVATIEEDKKIKCQKCKFFVRAKGNIIGEFGCTNKEMWEHYKKNTGCIGATESQPARQRPELTLS